MNPWKHPNRVQGRLENPHNTTWWIDVSPEQYKAGPRDSKLFYTAFIL